MVQSSIWCWLWEEEVVLGSDGLCSILPPCPVTHNEASYILSLCGTPEPLPTPLDAQSCVSVGGRLWGPQEAVFLAQRALAGYWVLVCSPVCFPLLWRCPWFSIKYFLTSWNLSSIAQMWLKSKWTQGIPQWFSGYDSLFSLLRAGVQSLVGELRSHKTGVILVLSLAKKTQNGPSAHPVTPGWRTVTMEGNVPLEEFSNCKCILRSVLEPTVTCARANHWHLSQTHINWLHVGSLKLAMVNSIYRNWQYKSVLPPKLVVKSIFQHTTDVGGRNQESEFSLTEMLQDIWAWFKKSPQELNQHCILLWLEYCWGLRFLYHGEADTEIGWGVMSYDGSL